MGTERLNQRTAAVCAAVLGCVMTLGASAGAVPASATATPSRHGLGLRPTPTVVRAQSTSEIAASEHALIGLPTSVDLTADAPPAGDQGAVSSCVSWAIDYTAMGYYLNHTNTSGAPLAPMYTYSQVNHGSDNGSSFEETFAVADSQGVDSGSDYSHGNYDWVHTPSAGERANAANWVLSGYDTLDVGGAASVTKANIETALVAGKPVVLGIPVHDGFFYLGPGHSDWNTPTGTFAGYHAVTALGYDTYGVTIENSWSSGWGADGFARLSWAFVDQQVFAAYSMNDVISTSTLPRATLVRPAVGRIAGGQAVTITGVNFAADSSVKFGGATASNVVVDVSGTHITLHAPAHAKGAVSVVIYGSSGTSRPNAAATYRYEAAPTIASVSNRVGVTSGGAHITVNGTNLFAASVSFGATHASATVNGTGTALNVKVPAHTAGLATITVVTPAGTVRGPSYRYTR
ncbi:MAG: hypothetical protein JWL83_3278 [Actinomycetia bacterium]|nr:hypothetical protein [Actinomycetes bacterium]